jgi:hypothetical protein
MACVLVDKRKRLEAAGSFETSVPLPYYTVPYLRNL